MKQIALLLFTIIFLQGCAADLIFKFYSDNSQAIANEMLGAAKEVGRVIVTGELIDAEERKRMSESKRHLHQTQRE